MEENNATHVVFMKCLQKKECFANECMINLGQYLLHTGNLEPHLYIHTYICISWTLWQKKQNTKDIFVVKHL